MSMVPVDEKAFRIMCRLMDRAIMFHHASEEETKAFQSNDPALHANLERLRAEKVKAEEELFRVVDELNRQYGKFYKWIVGEEDQI